MISINEFIKYTTQIIYIYIYCRVRGSMQNSPEFHKTWKCTKGTHMNPIT